MLYGIMHLTKKTQNRVPAIDCDENAMITAIGIRLGIGIHHRLHTPSTKPAEYYTKSFPSLRKNKFSICKTTPSHNATNKLQHQAYWFVFSPEDDTMDRRFEN